MLRIRPITLALAFLSLGWQSVDAGTALFTFPSQFNSNINNTYVVDGVTVVCSTDMTANSYDGTGNPTGCAQTVGGYSFDSADGALAASLRLSDQSTGNSFAAAWLTFSPDVYQLEFKAWQMINNNFPFLIEAYDPSGTLVTSWQTQAATPLETPGYESKSFAGDTPIRRLRLIGRINMVSFDNLRVWTESVTPVRPTSWGSVKARFR